MKRIIECACGNDARYINERGELCCGICPIKEKLDSIKIADVGRALVLLRKLLAIENTGYGWGYRVELREIIGKVPS